MWSILFDNIIAKCKDENNNKIWYDSFSEAKRYRGETVKQSITHIEMGHNEM